MRQEDNVARAPSDDPETAFASPAVAPSKPRLFKVLGPGLITGASDDDPSGIATYSQAGAQFSYALAWTMLFSYPLMVAVQMVSARLGRTTGHGIAGNLARHYPAWLLHGAVTLLLVANTINIGADLGAMGDALALIAGGPALAYVVGFGVLCIVLQIFVQYTRYVSILKWLTVALFAYFGVLLVAKVDWGAALRGLLLPELRFDKDHVTTIVAILGTTISPYLFFWQASQEVEDIDAHPRRQRLKSAPRQGEPALQRIEYDTLVGMGLSNLVALAIMLTAASTLNLAGIKEIGSSAEAAEALRPIAGEFAAIIFAIGIIGTGLLAVPVLAGSAAYAIGEARRWDIGLARQFKEAKAFYLTIAVATLIGIAINFAPINPIRALYWSAVINGVVGVPIMAVMMLMASRKAIMGKFVVPAAMKIAGWCATVVMAAAVVTMGVTSL
jgi:NRAMP (natural resistance-associated macrophage protein)-like metal ion transporter